MRSKLHSKAAVKPPMPTAHESIADNNPPNKLITSMAKATVHSTVYYTSAWNRLRSEWFNVT